LPAPGTKPPTFPIAPKGRRRLIGRSKLPPPLRGFKFVRLRLPGAGKKPPAPGYIPLPLRGSLLMEYSLVADSRYRNPTALIWSIPKLYMGWGPEDDLGSQFHRSDLVNSNLPSSLERPLIIQAIPARNPTVRGNFTGNNVRMVFWLHQRRLVAIPPPCPGQFQPKRRRGRTFTSFSRNPTTLTWSVPVMMSRPPAFTSKTRRKPTA